MTEKLKFAVIGVGIMGSSHVRDIANSENVTLAAICDLDPQRAQTTAAAHGVPAYTDYREMIDKEKLDGVIIATPHYYHTPIAIYAMQHGVNALTEKPEAVHVKDARRMNAAYDEAKQKYPELIFAIMFQNRTNGHVCQAEGNDRQRRTGQTRPYHLDCHRLVPHPGLLR